jgi:hypothetical protein
MHTGERANHVPGVASAALNTPVTQMVPNSRHRDTTATQGSHLRENRRRSSRSVATLTRLTVLWNGGDASVQCGKWQAQEWHISKGHSCGDLIKHRLSARTQRGRKVQPGRWVGGGWNFSDDPRKHGALGSGTEELSRSNLVIGTQVAAPTRRRSRNEFLTGLCSSVLSLKRQSDATREDSVRGQNPWDSCQAAAISCHSNDAKIP